MKVGVRRGSPLRGTDRALGPCRACTEAPDQAERVCPQVDSGRTRGSRRPRRCRVHELVRDGGISGGASGGTATNGARSSGWYWPARTRTVRVALEERQVGCMPSGAAASGLVMNVGSTLLDATL